LDLIEGLRVYSNLYYVLIKLLTSAVVPVETYQGL